MSINQPINYFHLLNFKKKKKMTRMMSLDNHMTCLKFILKLHPLGFNRHMSVMMKLVGAQELNTR